MIDRVPVAAPGLWTTYAGVLVMLRPRTVLLLSVLLSSARGNASTQDTRADEQARLRETLKNLVGGATAALQPLAEMEKEATVKIFNTDKLLANLKGLPDRMFAAAERIKVHPRANEAAEAFARSQFSTALSRIRQALADSPDQAYSHYLAGLTLMELGRYRAAAGHFDRTRALEPQSRSSLLLGGVCRQLSASGPSKQPADYQTIVQAYFRVLPDVRRELKLDEQRGLAGIFTAPMFEDPLIYKLDAETLAGRGPLRLVPGPLLDAAVELDDAYVWYLLLEVLDEQAAATVKRELSGTRHREALASLEFLLKWFDRSNSYRERPRIFINGLADLTVKHPDEGLWPLLGIRHSEPDSDTLAVEPLSLSEFKRLEQATKRGRLTLPRGSIAAARRKLLQKAASPLWLRDTIITPRIPNLLGFMRNVVGKRGAALVEDAAKRGDHELARRAASAIYAFADKLSVADGQVLLRLIRSAIRRNAAKAALSHIDLRADERVSHHQVRAAAMTEQTHVRVFSTMAGINSPSPALTRAFALVYDNIDGDARELVWLCANTLGRDLGVPGRLRSAIEYDYVHRSYRHILDAGALRLKSTAPLLRQFAKLDLDEDHLWALVWATGQIRDREQIPWLMQCLSDKRPWLPLTAAEALRNITGRDHGTDPAAWRRTLTDDPHTKNAGSDPP